MTTPYLNQAIGVPSHALTPLGEGQAAAAGAPLGEALAACKGEWSEVNPKPYI